MPRVSRDEPQPYHRVILRIIDVLDHLKTRRSRKGDADDGGMIHHHGCWRYFPLNRSTVCGVKIKRQRELYRAGAAGL